ncbi:MAG: hypothetical protein JXM72_10065 [Deltaproteobacteria bacterium]|nr:hypothetical protein [Deltaproteobacteria bacterium]
MKSSPVNSLRALRGVISLYMLFITTQVEGFRLSGKDEEAEGRKQAFVVFGDEDEAFPDAILCCLDAGIEA